jgi:hypothetical protein
MWRRLHRTPLFDGATIAQNHPIDGLSGESDQSLGACCPARLLHCVVPSGTVEMVGFT